MLTGLSDNLLKLEYCPGFKKLTNESWASEGGKGGLGSWILKILQRLFSYFRVVKNKFSHFLPPYKNLGKIPKFPPGKILLRSMQQIVKSRNM